MAKEDYEVVIDLKFTQNFQQKQKYSANVRQNLVEDQICKHVQFVWLCQELFQY